MSYSNGLASADAQKTPLWIILFHSIFFNLDHDSLNPLLSLIPLGSTEEVGAAGQAKKKLQYSARFRPKKNRNKTAMEAIEGAVGDREEGAGAQSLWLQSVVEKAVRLVLMERRPSDVRPSRSISVDEVLHYKWLFRSSFVVQAPLRPGLSFPAFCAVEPPSWPLKKSCFVDRPNSYQKFLPLHCLPVGVPRTISEILRRS